LIGKSATGLVRTLIWLVSYDELEKKPVYYILCVRFLKLEKCVDCQI